MSESIFDTSLPNHNDNPSVSKSNDMSSGGSSSVNDDPSRNTRNSSEDNKPKSYKPGPKSRMQARNAKMNGKNHQNEPLIKKDEVRKTPSNENDILQDINNMGESDTRSVENGLSMNADQNTPTKRSKISSSQKIKSKKHSESTSTHDESISNGETIDSTKEHKHQENILGGENSSNSEAEEDRLIKHVNNCELKKNEIRSKLQTCIAVCFPSLEDQDREKKSNDDHDAVELTHKISRNPKLTATCFGRTSNYGR